MLNQEKINARLSVFNKILDVIPRLDTLTEEEKNQLPKASKLIQAAINNWKTITVQRSCKKGRV